MEDIPLLEFDEDRHALIEPSRLYITIFTAIILLRLYTTGM
jgi:hypothetical protein